MKTMLLERSSFRIWFVLIVCLTMVCSASAQRPVQVLQVADSPSRDGVTLAGADVLADIFVDATDFEVVQIAAECLRTDVERVTGRKPRIVRDRQALAAQAVIIGTLGRSALIDDLICTGRLDVSAISGKWESFVVATVRAPLAGVQSALVIAGSDRRGTAFGVFTLSEAIGVSPWCWWADVPPVRRETLAVKAGSLVLGPPSVKYRGIFINDEDWGLQPWAAKTFEPEVGDIGPKTYAKVCELLLRLKGNYLWPAMHPCTKAFNFYPENKLVADRYAIVMGSSHCEQMLRNNVDEWDKARFGDWNPVTNLKRIEEYWEQRVRENGKFESVWTVGMRGIHDGAMPGGGTIPEKRQRMEKIIELQREMLARHVNPDAARVPQIFCPYKEVLDIYKSGLKLPDDIMIVWPDDNHGYIRQLPNAAERRRSGGHGVYYHVSYWGRPHDYLWLESTSPALIWHEMAKSHALGARELWVLNVGDIKPLEAGTTLFLKLAWDIDAYGLDVQQRFLRDFYHQQFGARHGDAIARLKDEYFRLCAVRRPEHLGFNGVYPNAPVQNSGWSLERSQRLLEQWIELARATEALAVQLPAESRNAYFQLVEYPASAGAALVEKLFLAEKARLSGSTEFAQRSEAAFKRIQQLTERYNDQNDGKWRGMMDYRPRNLPVFDKPSTEPQETKPAPVAPTNAPVIEINPADFSTRRDQNGAGWRIVEGLGPRGRAVAVLPWQEVSTARSAEEIRTRPMLEYKLELEKTGELDITIEALPTHPFTAAHAAVIAVSINDEAPAVIRFERSDEENNRVWQRNVLRSAMHGKTTLRPAARANRIQLWAADPSVVVQGITIETKPLRSVH